MHDPLNAADAGRLKDTALFRGMRPDQIGKILAVSRRVTFGAGHLIMKERDQGDSLYILLEGAVEIVKTLILGEADEEADGKTKVFTRLDPSGDPVFGEMALLEDGPRSATVRAVTACSLLEIRKADFFDLAERDCELACRVLLNLGRIVSARLRKADEDTIKLTTALSIVLKDV